MVWPVGWSPLTAREGGVCSLRMRKKGRQSEGWRKYEKNQGPSTWKTEVLWTGQARERPPNSVRPGLSVRFLAEVAHKFGAHILQGAQASCHSQGSRPKNPTNYNQNKASAKQKEHVDCRKHRKMSETHQLWEMLKAPMCFLRLSQWVHSHLIQGSQAATKHDHGITGLLQTKAVSHTYSALVHCQYVVTRRQLLLEVFCCCCCSFTFIFRLYISVNVHRHAEQKKKKKLKKRRKCQLYQGAINFSYISQ